MALPDSQNEVTARRLASLISNFWTNKIKVTFQTLTNKVTSWSATPSDDKYPSEKLVKTSLDAKAPLAFTTEAAIASGDKLLFSDSSDSSKIKRNSTAFDGSSLGLLLSKKGTFEYPKEAFLEWGGKNFAGSYGPIDAAMVSQLGACRTAFCKANGVVIEYTRDGGTTWLDYEANNDSKVGLFSTSATITLGKCDSNNKATSGNNWQNYKTRIRIISPTFGLYTNLNKFVILVSTSGSNGCQVTIKTMSRTAEEAGSQTWVTRATASLSGWSGYNVVNTNNITTWSGSTSQKTQDSIVEFLFEATQASSSDQYNGLSIFSIYGYGGVGWTCPSTMAKTGHLYSFDVNQNATFPANVKATTFEGKFKTARKLSVSLSNTSTDTSFDGSADVTNIKTTGTLGVGNGGTGRTLVTSGNYLTGNGASSLNEKTPKQVGNDVLSKLDEGSAAFSTDNAVLITGDADAANTTTFYRRKFSYIWTWIKSKLANDSNVNISGNAATATTAANYSAGGGIATALGTKENASNKSQSIITDSTTDFPSSKAVADFVNSSVATNTANFLGTFTLSDLALSYGATNAQIATALNNHTWPSGVTPTNNDYVFIVIDDPSTHNVDEYRRFKYSTASNNNAATWAYEYTLNHSSFTATQWDAIISGINATKVSSYDTHIADTTIHVTSTDKTNWNNKVPNTRKVNNKQLNADITLNASDVGAAPTDHSSTATTYGKATSTKYGHVMLFDNVSGESTNGAPTQNAVHDALAEKAQVPLVITMSLNIQLLIMNSDTSPADFLAAYNAGRNTLFKLLYIDGSEGLFYPTMISSAGTSSGVFPSTAQCQICLTRGYLSGSSSTVQNLLIGIDSSGTTWVGAALLPALVNVGTDLALDTTNSNLVQVNTSGSVTGYGLGTGHGFVEGTATSVSAANGHAEGDGTSVSATNGHAEGNSSIVTAVGGHAEGYNSEVTSEYGHAEGRSSVASGQYSHAEGYGSEASGLASHAEGRLTAASASHAHSEGYDTTASGVRSHAEGDGTTASAWSSHAEGRSSSATGESAHAEGGIWISSNNTVVRNAPSASGDRSHAEGTGTTASGHQSHAEGELSVASGTCSHAEGFDTDADGAQSHAEGNKTLANADSAHAEGYKTKAKSAYSHAEGNETEASALQAHAEGCKTLAGGITSHAEGSVCITMGTSAHAEGGGTFAKGKDSHAEGYSGSSNNSPNNYSYTNGSAIASGTSTFTVPNEDVDLSAKRFIAIPAIGYFAAITSVSGRTITADSSTAYRLDAGNTILVGSSGSLGDSSHTEGVNTLATNWATHAEGSDTVAGGTYSHAEGFNTNASGTSAHAEGYNTEAWADFSHAEGQGTKAQSIGMHAAGRYNATTSGYARVTGWGIGNATADRKDIERLDTDGNLWVRGIVHGATPFVITPGTTTYSEVYDAIFDKRPILIDMSGLTGLVNTIYANAIVRAVPTNQQMTSWEFHFKVDYAYNWRAAWMAGGQEPNAMVRIIYICVNESGWYKLSSGTNDWRALNDSEYGFYSVPVEYASNADTATYASNAVGNLANDLANKSNVGHKHPISDLTMGILAVGNGGTGQSTEQGIVDNVIQAGLGTGDSDCTDNTDIITSITTGYTSTNKRLYRRKASYLWGYIKTKLGISSGAGTDTVPIYIDSNGVAKRISRALILDDPRDVTYKNAYIRAKIDSTHHITLESWNDSGTIHSGVHGQNGSSSAKFLIDLRSDNNVYINGGKATSKSNSSEVYIESIYDSDNVATISAHKTYNRCGLWAKCNGSGGWVAYRDNNGRNYYPGYLCFFDTNEINFANVPSQGNKDRVWFNYRNGDTHAADSNNKIAHYYFGNRNNSTSGVFLHADGAQADDNVFAIRNAAGNAGTLTAGNLRASNIIAKNAAFNVTNTDVTTRGNGQLYFYRNTHTAAITATWHWNTSNTTQTTSGQIQPGCTGVFQLVNNTNNIFSRIS